MKKILIIMNFVVLCILTTSFAQDAPKIPNGSKLAMYVEYGGKGIKLGVLAFTDAKYRKYVPVENKDLNIGLSKAIQSTGKIAPGDIASAASSSYDAYQALLTKYQAFGLKNENVFFYTSSGLGVASNIQELCDAVKSKTGKNVYVVKETEESKYTIAGTIPFEKIEVAMVLDQGGSNTKGGYVIKDGNSLTGIPTNFDLGSVRVYDLITTNYMTSQPDDQNEFRQVFITGMNKCFDSLKISIKRTFSNIEGAEDRNELYLSGGAAYCISTLLYPTASLDDQMVPVDFDKLKAFLTDIQDRDTYKAFKEKTFENPKIQKNYKNALAIYTQLQLVSAAKLLVTYISALGGDEKKIYFNRYGIHAMPSMLMGRVLRGDVSRW